MPDDTYRQLISLLDTSCVDYGLIEHEPEGAAEAVSALRGHPAS